MVITKCDQCGQEQTPSILVSSVSVDVNGMGGFRVDLCSPHLKDFLVGLEKLESLPSPAQVVVELAKAKVS